MKIFNILFFSLFSVALSAEICSSSALDREFSDGVRTTVIKHSEDSPNLVVIAYPKYFRNLALLWAGFIEEGKNGTKLSLELVKSTKGENYESSVLIGAGNHTNYIFSAKYGQRESKNQCEYNVFTEIWP